MKSPKEGECISEPAISSLLRLFENLFVAAASIIAVLDLQGEVLIQKAVL